MTSKSVSVSLLIGTFAVMVLAASTVQAVPCGAGASTSWASPTPGSWFTSGNWTNGIPDSGKCVFINNFGPVTIGSGSGDASAYNVVLGNFQGDSGSLVVDGAVLDVAPYDPDCGGPIYVGSQGTGNLTITDGGTVNARYLYIGASTNLSLPNGSGSVGLDGSGNSLVINPGECSGAGICIGCGPDFNDGGTGVLDIKDGTVEVDNLGTVSLPGVRVGPSGTLEGNSTLTLTGTSDGAKTVRVRGTVAPSSTLTIAGNLDLTDGGGTTHAATTIFHVNPTVQDKVEVSSSTGGGAATLDGHLIVVISGTFSLPTSYTLVHACTSLGGTFYSQSIFSTGVCSDISYDYVANTVKLNLHTCP